MNEAAALLRRGLILEGITLAWNVVGAGIVLGAALAARSVALMGFGLDSLVEIAASMVVIWQLRGVGRHRETTALRSIAVAFWVLAVYVLAQSMISLSLRIRPGSSPGGVVWLAATFAVMLLLAAGKYRTGRRLDNPVLQAEARVTLVDAYLAGSVLIGLVLNAACGWWWADPLAGLVIVFYGVIEGRHAWREARGPA